MVNRYKSLKKKNLNIQRCNFKVEKLEMLCSDNPVKDGEILDKRKDLKLVDEVAMQPEKETKEKKII